MRWAGKEIFQDSDTVDKTAQKSHLSWGEKWEERIQGFGSMTWNGHWDSTQIEEIGWVMIEGETWRQFQFKHLTSCTNQIHQVKRWILTIESSNQENSRNSSSNNRIRHRPDLILSASPPRFPSKSSSAFPPPPTRAPEQKRAWQPRQRQI